MSEERFPLSPEGLKRREEILALAKQQARHRRAVRNTQHAGVYILLAAAAALFLRHPSTPRVIVSTSANPASHPSDIARPSDSLVTYIHTDPDIAERLSAPAQAPAWKQISDDQLLHMLAQAGHPAGLIHVSGKTILLPR